MGEKTGISWTDKTWNPWHGCLKVSPGCKFCYMYRDKERYGQDPHVVLRSKSCFNDPLKWKSGRVFTCSWSDFFIEQADAWRDDAWDVIRRTPHLTYQILTKRPERIAEHLPKDWGEGWPHVWLGTSVENQEYADKRVPVLLRVPAKVRFLSVEPLLEEISLRWKNSTPFGETHPRHLKPKPDERGRICTDEYDGLRELHWVICGGESGPGARPFDLKWAESLLNECRAAKVPFFLKQFGAYARDYGQPMNLRDRKGADPMEWPEDLRVQEFPGERESL